MKAKAAIYARVSTIDKQEVENQVEELQSYCNKREFDLVRVYIDRGWSGAKEDRPEFKQMLADAFKREFDVLIVWKLDRLSRSLNPTSALFW